MIWVFNILLAWINNLTLHLINFSQQHIYSMRCLTSFPSISRFRYIALFSLWFENFNLFLLIDHSILHLLKHLFIMLNHNIRILKLRWNGLIIIHKCTHFLNWRMLWIKHACVNQNIIDILSFLISKSIINRWNFR